LVIPAAAAIAGALVVIMRLALRQLPPADHPRCFDADKHDSTAGRLLDRTREVEPLLSSALIEKLGLVTLVGMVFTEFIPGINENSLQVTFGLAFLVVANAALNVWFAGQGRRWRTPTGEFAVTCAINAPIMVVLAVTANWMNVTVALWATLFLVLLASLLIGLHDRYREVHRWRQLPDDGLWRS
jgi:hypothetical protein